jgi:hypothetical protein
LKDSLEVLDPERPIREADIGIFSYELLIWKLPFHPQGEGPLERTGVAR